MTAAAALVAGIFGLAFGSFLNVVVYRLPRRESLTSPGSRCPSCGTPLRPRDNIPVLSWLLLGGRCRACGAGISVRYPVGELLTAALWVLAVVRIGGCRNCAAWDAVPFIPFFWALAALSLIDLKHKLIPSRLLYPFLALGVVLIGLAAAAGPRGFGAFGRAAGAGAISFAVFNLIHLVSPGGMGYGDVRLSGLIGLHLGYLGWGRVYAGFLLGFLLGALVGIILMALGKAGRKTAIPFGPFMALGAILASLWGEPIVRLWTR